MIPPKEPRFSDFYQPSEQQKKGELMFLGHLGFCSGLRSLPVPLNFPTKLYSNAMDSNLTSVYYSPWGYWKGIAAIKNLSEPAKVPGDTAKTWLVK